MNAYLPQSMYNTFNLHTKLAAGWTVSRDDPDSSCEEPDDELASVVVLGGSTLLSSEDKSTCPMCMYTSTNYQENMVWLTWPM